MQFLSSRTLHGVTVILSFHHSWLHGLTIKMSGDVEPTPGPNQKRNQSLSICHGNLNSITDHNFENKNFWKAISSNKVDILCLSQNFLNSDISCEDSNLQPPGFNLTRAI